MRQFDLMAILQMVEHKVRLRIGRYPSVSFASLLNILLCLYIFFIRHEIRRVRQNKRIIRFLMVQLLSYKKANSKRTLSRALKVRIAMRAMFLRKWQKFCIVVDVRTIKKWQANLWLLLFKGLWRFWSKSDQSGNRLPDATMRRLRQLITENPHWGGVRLWSQMKQLGFEISLTSIYNYKRRYFPRPNIGSWWDLIADTGTLAMDFCTIPVVTSAFSRSEVYLFFIIENATRKILYLNTTQNPTTEWVKQQFRNSDFSAKHKRIVMDNDSIFSKGLAKWLKSRYAWTVLRTTYQSPWQNPYAERWVGSIKKELLYRQPFATEKGLRNAAKQYVAYYNEHRPHSSLEGRTPLQLAIPPATKGPKLVRARHFGLENSYRWALPSESGSEAA